MSNEWYTPSKYIEAAREVMGTIDLDPASCELANKTVQATQYYTKEQDGLTLPWHGNVWLNPPYAKEKNRSVISYWLNTLIQHFEDGKVTQAVFLATQKSDAQWFKPVWNYPVCFTTHRIHFFVPSLAGLQKDSRGGHPFGSIFVYFGSNEQKFRDVFSQFGHVVMPERVVV